MKINLRLLYLYLFSFVGLIIVVVGSITLVNLGLRTFVLKDADRYEIYRPTPIEEKNAPEFSVEEEKARQERDLSRQRQRQLADAIAMIVVGGPLYLYHWKTIQREAQKLETA